MRVGHWWMRVGGAVAIAVTASAARAAVAVTADRFRPLRSASATATSFLQNNWNSYQENYHPSYVLDENPATAWVEGAQGYGEGQSLTIPLSPLTSARALRLRIWNGYQKSRDLFAKNSMPRRIRVTVLDPTGGEVTSRESELQRAWGPQTVVLDIPPKRGLSAVRLSIVSVYPGTKYKDTCISDVLVDVDSEVPHNAAAENAKLAALKAWIAERKKTAAYFAAKPAEFPFAFTHFSATSEEFDRAEFKRRFAEADALRAQLAETRFTPVTKRRIQSRAGRALAGHRGVGRPQRQGLSAALLAVGGRAARDRRAVFVPSQGGRPPGPLFRGVDHQLARRLRGRLAQALQAAGLRSQGGVDGTDDLDERPRAAAGLRRQRTAAAGLPQEPRGARLRLPVDSPVGDLLLHVRRRRQGGEGRAPGLQELARPSGEETGTRSKGDPRPVLGRSRSRRRKPAP